MTAPVAPAESAAAFLAALAPGSQPAAGARMNSAYDGHGGAFECIDAVEPLGLGFCLGNALKYLWRHRQKNGREDLEKAAWYLTREADGRPKLSKLLRRSDDAVRFILAWRRRMAMADVDMLAGAAGMSHGERLDLEEIARGNASAAAWQARLLIAEVYPAPEACDSGRQARLAHATDPATGFVAEVHPQT